MPATSFKEEKKMGTFKLMFSTGIVWMPANNLPHAKILWEKIEDPEFGVFLGAVEVRSNSDLA
jgi:hypothetical protein